MKFFPLHIIIKDCSYLLAYFVILRYNLTGETFLPKMVSNFPEASRMTIAEMIAGAIFYNILPILISLLSYFIIYYLIKKLFGKTTTASLLVTGFFLTVTTPLCYILLDGYEPFRYKAEAYAWICCFVLSIATYYFLNRNNKKNELVIGGQTAANTSGCCTTQF